MLLVGCAIGALAGAGKVRDIAHGAQCWCQPREDVFDLDGCVLVELGAFQVADQIQDLSRRFLCQSVRIALDALKSVDVVAHDSCLFFGLEIGVQIAEMLTDLFKIASSLDSLVDQVIAFRGDLREGCAIQDAVLQTS